MSFIYSDTMSSHVMSPMDHTQMTCIC